MKKKYFTEEEKKQAQKQWRKKDYYKNHEKRLKEMKERHQKNKEKYNKNRQEKYQEKLKNPLFRQQENERNRKIRENDRKICIKHYTQGENKCQICGENDIDVLTIDHKNGGGNQHRKKVGFHITRYLIKNNFPEGYQILCMNCNMKQAKKQKLYGTHQFIKK